MFKVVPDQLRISDGWVRCGQCDEVFDANAHLQAGFDATPVSAPSEPPKAMNWGGILEADTSAPELPIPLEFPAAPPPDAPVSVKPSELDPIPSAFAFDDHRVNTNELAPFDAGMASVAVGTPATSPLARVPEIPQFLKQQPAKPAKDGRLGRFSAIVLSVLLSLTLVTQAVVQERDRIAANAPLLSKWLEPVCEVLGCKISPLQQIESIVIDHSSFSKGQSEGYVLGFAVKSTALTEVAIPSLELTLTDMQDRAVIRRVFSPRELGYQKSVLSPGGEWSASVPVDVKSIEGGERISGYRLLAFYP